MNVWGIPGVKSDRIFGPPPENYEEPEFGSDLRLACNWFKQFMAPNEWHTRRIEVAKRLYKVSRGDVENESDKGRFFETTDTFAWYLFLCESILEHPWNYEPIFGSRVLPIFIAIGRNLRVLQDVVGVNARVQRVVGSEKAQPNGGLFELLVAAAYMRAGAAVTFLHERPGVARTHDMNVTLSGRHWAVECKRMETSEYGERERRRMRELWGPSAAFLSREKYNVIANANFKVEIQNVPYAYLTNLTKKFLAAGRGPMLWDDAVAEGSISEIDLRPLQSVLASDDVLISSTRMQQLLTGQYVRNNNIIQLIRCKSNLSPRYASECELAVVLTWQCLAEASILAKARAITKRLSQANDQLPNGMSSIVHIGFETVNGDAVEAARYDKIISGVSDFDPGAKNLQYVYCHYFAPESPPDELFAFDETTQWLAVRPVWPRPLAVGHLVIPDDNPSRTGVHWG